MFFFIYLSSMELGIVNRIIDFFKEDDNVRKLIRRVIVFFFVFIDSIEDVLFWVLEDGGEIDLIDMFIYYVIE